MKLLLENIADIQEIYGTRIIYNNVSCIKNIIDKDMFNKLFTVKQRIRKSKTISNGIQWMLMNS